MICQLDQAYCHFFLRDKHEEQHRPAFHGVSDKQAMCINSLVQGNTNEILA